MSGSTDGEQWMDLADAVSLLRTQIAEAQSRVAVTPAGEERHSGVLFTLDEITLNLGLELTKTTAANGGLRWSVISLSGKRESGTKTTHSLTVKLRPHAPGGGALDIDDDA